MNREEQKYLIALGNLQNMAIDNTKGSKAVEICTNDIRTYVERLNNIIDELEKEIKFQRKCSLGLKNGFGVSLCDIFLNKFKELKGDNKKELHANNIEFNINNDKRDCIITLDENDLGIDKLHLDNCYFYKENDKWYVKHINLNPVAYISQEHKIPEKFEIYDNSIEWCCNGRSITDNEKDIMNKINEIIDYLEEIE